MTKYKLSPNGVFWSLQGEGHLRGFQMAFVRLAGCSVGCPECDTDYTVGTKPLTVTEIVGMVEACTPVVRDLWVWITGGEPTDRNLMPLLRGLRAAGYSTCVATSGVRRLLPPLDWLSVSPHGGSPLTQRYGNEIKLVEGLNGLDLNQWIAANPDESTDFWYRYVQPLTLADGSESKESLDRCLDFLKRHPSWSMSRQDHKNWSVA